MTSSRTRCLALFVSLTLVAPTIAVIEEAPAFAQAKKKPLREQLPEAARKQWDAAVELYKAGKWDGARTSFMAAYDASKNPRVLFNVAVCEKNMERYADAIATYRRELDEGKGQLSADEEAEVKAQIDGLSKFTAQLVIDVNEPGAEVTIDGKRVASTKDPVNVAIGERRVRASKPGFADAAESVDIKGGETKRVTLKLEPIARTSRVTVNIVGPATASVKVDGNEVGTATREKAYTGQVAVRADPHTFTAEAPGWVGTPQTAVVKEGEPLTLTLQLAPEQAKGKLTVVSRVEGATIDIDGKTVGASRWEGPVDVGTHQIVVKKKGYYPWSQDVEVTRGAERTVSAPLNEDRNTSFVPWLIGTVLVVGGTTAAIIIMTKPKDEEPVKGTLPPFTVGTPSVRF
jgi:hypothetical protein